MTYRTTHLRTGKPVEHATTLEVAQFLWAKSDTQTEPELLQHEVEQAVDTNGKFTCGNYVVTKVLDPTGDVEKKNAHTHTHARVGALRALVARCHQKTNAFLNLSLLTETEAEVLSLGLTLVNELPLDTDRISMVPLSRDEAEAVAKDDNVIVMPEPHSDDS